MEIANVRLRLNKTGSDIPLFGVTPAEVIFLHMLHQGNNGGNSFGDKLENIMLLGEAVAGYKVTPAVEAQPAVPPQPAVGNPKDKDYLPPVPGKPAVEAVPEKREPIPRIDAQEIARLRAKYGANVDKKGTKLINQVWPGINPSLPKTFGEIQWQGVQFDDNQLGALNMATGQPMPTLPA